MRISVVISLTLALIALAVFGSGLNGMSTIELGKNYCDSKDDCSDSCCFYYNSNHGICDKQSNCDSIKLLSLEQAKSISTATNPMLVLSSRLPKFLSSNMQFEGKVSLKNSIIASALLLILALFVLMVGNKRGV